MPCLVHRRTAQGCEWARLPLDPLREIGATGVAAEIRNADNMVRDIVRKTFHVPWDLHPLSLHAEFSHNTDILAWHSSNSNHGEGGNDGASAAPAESPPVRSDGEVGLRPHSAFGLGGGFCEDVMHDGSMLEVR